MKIMSEKKMQSLVGERFPAKKILSKTNHYAHADSMDGVHMLCTADVNLKRIHVEVKKGIITKVNGIG